MRILVETLGRRSWLYREGKARDYWILETSDAWIGDPRTLSCREEHLAYARGYFDAEGGVPHDANARFYLQFVQKNQNDLSHLRGLIEGLGIHCGKLHNPLRTVAPDMWRFYVRSESHLQFVEYVGSWHPRKRPRLEAWFDRRRARMKI
jgi:hypothetical protein